jgi:HK97 family phage portal protein
MLGRLVNGEERAVSFQTIWGSGADVEISNEAGVIIDDKTSMQIVAFFSAVNLISDTISTLPIDTFIRRDGVRSPYRPKPQWVNQPDVDTTRQAHYQQVLISMLVQGNAYVRVFRDRAGEVVNLVCLDPKTVEVTRNGIGRKMYRVDGEKRMLNSEEILHIPDLLEPGALVGTGRITRLKDALGLASALQKYASGFFGSGATAQGIIEVQEPLTRDQARELAETFDSRHKGWRKAHRTGVLTRGAKYNKTQVDNDSAQFIESRRFAVEEMARAFNIPLSFMGIPGTQSYASVEQNAIQFVTHTLRPYIEKLEWSYSTLLPNEAFLKFNIDGLLRGDVNSRVQAYSTMTTLGAYSVNEVRRFEDLPPVEGGDSHRVSLAMVDLTAQGIPAMEAKVNMATKMVQTGYDPEDTLKKLDLPPVQHDGGIPTTLQPEG